MKVWIKKFNVEMEVKTSGVEFEVRSPSNDHQGDLGQHRTERWSVEYGKIVV